MKQEKLRDLENFLQKRPSGQEAAKIVQHLAQQAGLSIADITKKLKIHRRTYYLWRNNKARPSYELWLRLCHAKA